MKILVFNPPFGVILCDEKTRAVLFVGNIYEP